MATCIALWLLRLMALMLLLVWLSSAITSVSSLISAHPGVVMPHVWIFVSSWTALVSGVDGFCLVYLLLHSSALSRGVAPSVSIWAVPSCMDVISSQFWFSCSFGLSLCRDASDFFRFMPDPFFGASETSSMPDVGHVVLSAANLLFFLPWWGNSDIRGVLSLGCIYCSYLDVATMLPPVRLLDTSPCSLGGWLSVLRCSFRRNINSTLTFNSTLRSTW